MMSLSSVHPRHAFRFVPRRLLTAGSVSTSSISASNNNAAAAASSTAAAAATYTAAATAATTASTSATTNTTLATDSSTLFNCPHRVPAQAKRHAMIQPEEMLSRKVFDSGLPENADVVIIGGGVTGSALLYELAEFTDLSRVILLERRAQPAGVASGPNNNSQTIHCGDIETNYTVEKASSVQRLAHMLRNFATKLPRAQQERTVARMQKMAIGVGAKECEFMEKRYNNFKPVFKNMQLLNAEQLANVEPAVVYTNMATRSVRPEPIVANYVPDEHAAVDYYHLTNNLIQLAQHNRNGRDVRALMGCAMWDIQRLDSGGWRVFTNKGPIDARFVVVASCGYSLLTAHRLGFGRQFSCLPVAGSFYFGPEILRGKVYAVQNPLLPFAAVHGDPDLVANRKTRFGPTALPLPLLERYRWSSFFDFLEVLKPSPSLFKVYWDLFANKTIRNYMIKNALFEVPIVNDRLFLNDVRKIVPSLKLEDLTYAHGFGGVRPQLIDKIQKKLLLGEGKISPPDESIIFNVTPSPGGTTCLGNAEVDMRKIVKQLGCNLDEHRFRQMLLEGEYPCAK